LSRPVSKVGMRLAPREEEERNALLHAAGYWGGKYRDSWAR